MTGLSSDKRYVFLFIDALGWEIVQRYHFMEQDLPHRSSVQMQFGYSSTAIPTILTGCRPEQHGHLSFYFYDHGKSPFGMFRIFRCLPFAGHPKAPWNRGRVRGWISRLLKKWLGYTGYFQLYNMPFDRLPYFDYCEKTDLFAARGLAPCENLRDILIKAKVPYHISDWKLPEEQNLLRAETLLSEDQTQFYFLYTAGFDGLLHQKIRDPDAIEKHLEMYTAHIRHMLDLLKQSGHEFVFTVFSDHGMTPLNGTADIKAAVEKLPLRFGTDYVACCDSTMFRVWFLKPEARQPIMDAVSAAHFSGHYLSAGDKQRYGLQFNGNQYGDEIFLMDPGIQIVPSDMGVKPLAGMHGFLPEDKDSQAVILSTSPLPRVLEVADYFKVMKKAVENLSSTVKQE